MTFLEKVLKGQARLADIEDYVERWHGSDSSQSLPKYLGLTEREYASWVEDSKSLSKLLASRRIATAKPLRRKRVAVA